MRKHHKDDMERLEMSILRQRSREALAVPREEVSHRVRPTSPRSPKPSRTLLTVVILASTLAIAFVLFSRLRQSARPQLALPLSSGEQHGTDVDDDTHTFQLHPQDHIHRQPTTIRQRWNISSGLRRPDGVLKRVYLVNDSFPGPTLEARSGDRVIIEVENSLDNEESISIHWHGISMRGTNDMDGAVGITQNPIPAGKTFTYDFTIEQIQHGTFWWHSHNAAQRADGMYGGLIVHQPVEEKPSDLQTVNDEHLLLISDWYHRSAIEALDFYMHAGSFGNEPVPDSVLLNGIGAFNCSDAVPARPLDCEQRAWDEHLALQLWSSKSAVIRVVNVGAYSGISLKMTDIKLVPFAVDGGNPIKRKAGRYVSSLQPGERVDMFVSSEQIESGKTTSFEISIGLDIAGFKYPNPALSPEHHFSGNWLQSSENSNPAENMETAEVLDDLILTSVKSPMSSLPSEADHTIVLYATTLKLSHLNNVPHGFINNTYWQPQSSPPEPLIALERGRWDKHQLVPQIPFNAESPLWVDIILNNLDEETHPFHLHGYDFWVISTYSSTFNWGSYNPLEDAEPPGGAYDLLTAVKKDTVQVPRRGYAVLRLKADNPGIWMFHCHVLWHQASGMAMALEVN